MPYAPSPKLPTTPADPVARFRGWVAHHPGIGEHLCAAHRQGRASYDAEFWRCWEAAQAGRYMLELMEPTKGPLN